MKPPEEVTLLARRRKEARAARDFAAADALRDEIKALGWEVKDGPDGFSLAPRAPYDVLPDLTALPDNSTAPALRRVSVTLLVEGWPDDLECCVQAIHAHTPDDVVVIALDVGNVDGAGDRLHQLAESAPDRLEAWHVAASADWGPARAALLRLDLAEAHVMMETSTLLQGDAIDPLVRALREPGVVAAGWRGANVNLADDWRSFDAAGPGEVDAVLGYLLAVRRDAAVAAGVPDPRARGYRNADLELSLALRATGGRVVVPTGDLPVRQERHRGYHDTDPETRDREGRRNYDRLLRRFRGRVDILAPRRPPDA